MIYESTDDKGISALFTRYGYYARLVGHDLDRVDEDMAASSLRTMGMIHSIREAIRQSKSIFRPAWPVMALRTLKVRISLTSQEESGESGMGLQ